MHYFKIASKPIHPKISKIAHWMHLCIIFSKAMHPKIKKTRLGCITSKQTPLVSIQNYKIPIWDVFLEVYVVTVLVGAFYKYKNKSFLLCVG